MTNRFFVKHVLCIPVSEWGDPRQTAVLSYLATLHVQQTVQ